MENAVALLMKFAYWEAIICGFRVVSDYGVAFYALKKNSDRQWLTDANEMAVLRGIVTGIIFGVGLIVEHLMNLGISF